MVERVVLHVGLPKTGTTYLQSVVWANQERLRAEDGVVVPGRNHREHLWAALDVQEREGLAKRDPRAPGTWERLASELAAAPEPVGLITHEFLCGASAEQARRAVARLAPARVEVVVTARHMAGMLAAGWQEMVKNGSAAGPRRAASPARHGEFSWQTWDLAGVLERWSEAVPYDRIHVVPVPGRTEPRDQHWRNFAEVVGVRGEYAAPEQPANPSLGAVQVELLRRVNAQVEGFDAAADRGRWIRGYLAEEHLAAQGGDRFGLDDDLIEDCRARSRRAVDLITTHGIPVVGDVTSLLVPDDLPQQRRLDSVTEAELLESSARLVAAMLTDVRDLSSGAAGRDREAPAGALGRMRRALSGRGRT